MTKSKYISFIALGLFMSNLILVGFIYFHRPKHSHPNEENRNIIIEKLGLDHTQILKYDTLIQWHRQGIKNEETEIIQIKDNLYSLLRTNSATSHKDSLIASLSRNQMDIENIHFKHFEDIKKLCTTKQLPKYDLLLTDIAAMFSRRKDIDRQPK